MRRVLITLLTRGRSGSAGSTRADSVALRAFLGNEGIDVPLDVANGCEVPAFLVFAIREADMVLNIVVPRSNAKKGQLEGSQD